MSPENPTHAAFNIRQQMFHECCAMAEYALAKGLQLPLDVAQTVDAFATAYDAVDNAPAQPDLAGLVSAHQTLSALVKPALPGSILLLNQEQKGSRIWTFLGPVPIIRQMMIAALFSMSFFILIALSPDITVGSGEILKSHGWPLLLSLLFYIAAAGLGASFAALYKANSYITEGTFDSTYHASYWIRFCLGLISGLVLSVMVSDDTLRGMGSASTGTPETGSSGAMSSTSHLLDPAFLRPLLAMLGGFSADLLYIVMNRLIETMSSLFQGSTKNLLAMKQQEADAQLAASKVQNQIDLAAKLVKLQQSVGSGTDPGEIQSKINQLLDEVMPNAQKTGG